MNRPFLIALVTVTLALGACGKSPAPRAGGKPVTHWVEAVRDPDPKVRSEAAVKLGNVGPADADAFAALVAALQDPDPRVRRAALDGVIKSGPAGKVAVPALTRMRDGDPVPFLRDLAGKALERVRG